MPPRISILLPAYNAERYIEEAARSILEQTFADFELLLIDDGSTDATGTIAGRYAEKYDWIDLINLPKRKGRNFAAKVHAFNAGKEGVKDVLYEVIGNLDADVSLDEDHFEFLMNKFRDDPELGVAGTIFTENGYSSAIDSFEGQNYVSGQCQMFRRQCFEEIGGYFPSKNGGIDWIAVTTARMIGWKTRSYRETDPAQPAAGACSRCALRPGLPLH